METFFNILTVLTSHLDDISANFYREYLVWSLLGVEALLILATFISLLIRVVSKNFHTHNLISEFSYWYRRNESFSPAVVEERISMMVAKEEGWTSRVLDFSRVTSPLLGLAGTLIGLQYAFANAGQGKAAIESGIATALDTTYAGIVLAVVSFLIIKFILQPYLDALSTQLLREFHKQKERLKRDANKKTAIRRDKLDCVKPLSLKEGKINECIE